jgi:pimeloyl-ACP methyl ester carboxylesterase
MNSMRHIAPGVVAREEEAPKVKRPARCHLSRQTLWVCLLVLVCSPAAADGWRSVNGHRLYFEQRGSGPPLILLHGGGSTPEDSFPAQFDIFAADHRVIAPEQAGHGRSPDIAGGYSYTGMMEDTVALLHGLKVNKADFVGWSDGGIVALMIAVRHSSLVRRLVVSGVNISPDGINSDDEDEALDASTAATQGSSWGSAPRFFPYTVLHGPTVDEKLRSLWRGSPTEAELSPALLQHVEKPVLLIAGEYDVVSLAHTLSIYCALPKADLYIVRGAGHGTFVESPDQVNPRILAFLGAK